MRINQTMHDPACLLSEKYPSKIFALFIKNQKRELNYKSLLEWPP